MAQQTINLGNIANDKTGDPIRTAFNKVNQNFTELYGSQGNLPSNIQLVMNNEADVTSVSGGAFKVKGGGQIDKSMYILGQLHVGVGSIDNVYVSPAIIAQRSGSSYVQNALINTDGHGSADFIAYADNGTEEQGWCDMGMSGSVFDDPAYTITEPGEGYIFVQGIDDGISHGSLVLCTGNQGTERNIIFGTGGFLHDCARMELKNTEQRLEILMTSEATSELPGAFWCAGGAQIEKNVNIGGSLYVGQGGTFNTLENTIMSAKKNHPEYITFGVINSNDNGSADIIAQANSGTAEFGWIDVGFCGETFNDQNFTITGPGDGYIFSAGFGNGTSKGNLVISTSGYGNEKDIIFGTDGFQAGNERIRLRHAQAQLHVEMQTDATSLSTGSIRTDGGLAVSKNIFTGGSYIASTAPKDGGVDSGNTVAIDLVKQVIKLGAGHYSLADGYEGQIIRFVRKTGVENTTTCRIHVTKCRIAGFEYTNNFMDPFASGDNIVTFIFTDGAWQSDKGLWD